MFWMGFIIGIFVGTNMGIVVAGLLAAKRRDAEDRSSETSLNHDVIDAV